MICPPMLGWSNWEPVIVAAVRVEVPSWVAIVNVAARSEVSSPVGAVKPKVIGTEMPLTFPIGGVMLELFVNERG